MTDIDMTKRPEPRPGDRLRGERTPVTVDTTKRIRPEWQKDLATFWATAMLFARRNTYRARKQAFYLPMYLGLLLMYSPRGLGRLVATLSRYLYDFDSAAVRHKHAADVETPEYVKAQNIRKANLKARWMVAGSIIAIVSVPVLAWTFPYALAAIIAAAGFIWTCKLIPGKEAWELLIAAGVALVLWFVVPLLAEQIPAPPTWSVVLVATASVLALGYHGRNLGTTIARDSGIQDAGIPAKPTKEMVIDALCRIGLPGMSLQQAERVHDEIRVIAPGVATSAHGYTIEMELPPGVTSAMVVGKRPELAGALRRDLGCVWPSGNEDRHPGYLRLFLSHRPMNSAKQPRCPIADGKRADIFEPLPLFTDEQMRWVNLTLAATPHLAVGGASGFGKSVWLRHLSCAVAFDPRVRIVVIDGKRSGDLDHLRKIAHAFHEGAEDEDIAATIATLKELVAEYMTRSKFLSKLPADERSPKVTSALASKYPKQLSPIVVFYDEVQEGTQYGVKTEKHDRDIRSEIIGLLTRLSRVGRSAGIFMVLASQRPEAEVIPSSIMGNCSIRVAFKVSDQAHNDQILGTSARRNGVDATMFGSRDKGMAWLKGGDDVDAQVVRSWADMVDVGLAVELMEKAYTLRVDGGWLTGEAAGEEPEPAFQPDLLDDVYEVVQENRCRNTSLDQLRDGLAMLRAGIYGKLDNDALGAMLRQAGVTPDSIHCPREGKTMRGVKADWITDAQDRRDGTAA